MTEGSIRSSGQMSHWILKKPDSAYAFAFCYLSCTLPYGLFCQIQYKPKFIHLKWHIFDRRGCRTWDLNTNHQLPMHSSIVTNSSHPMLKVFTAHRDQMPSVLKPAILAQQSFGAAIFSALTLSSTLQTQPDTRGNWRLKFGFSV